MRELRTNLTNQLNEIRTHPLITLGFSLFWTWVWTVVQSSFLNSGRIVEAIPGVAKWVLPLAAYGVTFLLLGLLFSLRRIAPRSPAYLISVALGTSFGVATLVVFFFFPTSNQTVNSILMAAGALIMGAGTACLHMEWGRLLGKLGPRKAIIHGTSGTLGAMLLILVISLLPDSLAWAAVGLLPPCCFATILLQRRQIPVSEQLDGQIKLYIPWRFLITSFIQGSSFGILQSILLIVGGTAESLLISVTGSVLGAVLVFIVVFFFRLDFNQLIYQVGFVALAASFTFMATAGSLFWGGWLLNAIGYRFIDILMWALCVYLIKQRGLPTNWVFSVTTCALLLGQVFGALSGSFVRDSFALRDTDLSLLSVAMVFIVLTGALLMSNQNNLRHGWGMIRPSEGDDASGAFMARCALITDGFDLTPRELEVFALLAQGFSKTQISERLYLSKETVKTHTRNIYKKMSIHSHEDVIKLCATLPKSVSGRGELPR